MNTENRSSLARSRDARWDLLLDGLSCWLLSIGVTSVYFCIIICCNGKFCFFYCNLIFYTVYVKYKNSCLFRCTGYCSD